MTLYRLVELPTDEPVQFLGIYTASWGASKPTVGFIEVNENVEQVKTVDERIAELEGTVEELEGEIDKLEGASA